MQTLVGTSGFSFDEWKGVFYPPELRARERLDFYASRLPAVEINNTFYRMPRAEMLAGWTERVPLGFRFAIKAPRRITHQQRLKGAEQSLAQLMDACAVLGDKLGPILFQLPPFFKKDTGVLREFLSVVHAGRAAFEFRHASWFDDEVYDVLGSGGAALVSGDPDDAPESLPLVPTANWGYLRLRAPEYSDAALDSWAARIAQQAWGEVFVFFKHEVQGPAFAEALLQRFAASSIPVPSGT
jgi:uncharacterized protein YecE (DUF72 family)